MKHSPDIRAWVIAGIFGLAAGLAQPASANVVSVIDQNAVGTPEQATVSCTGSVDPSCAGIVGGSLTLGGPGSNQVVGGTAGSLDLTDPYLAWIYDIGNDSEANVSSALNVLAGTTFGATDATRLESSSLGCSGDTCSFSTTFAWMVLKIGNKSAFINNLLADNLISVVFNPIAGTGSGLSNVTFYGVGSTVIPLPATLPLFLTGLLGMGFLARRRRQMAEA